MEEARINLALILDLKRNLIKIYSLKEKKVILFRKPN